MRFHGYLRFLAVLAVAIAIAIVFPPPALAASPSSELAAFTLAADNLPTAETLVLASAPTQLHTYNFRHQILIKNNGPNRIWCAVGPSSLAVVGKAIPIDANGGWISMPLAPEMPVWCIAETANQVTTAATTTLEVP